MKNMRIWLWVLLPGALATQAEAQMQWPEGRSAAIVLTYDDALRSQLDIAIPQLAATGLRGTFFLDGDIDLDGLRRWREVQRAGHELGNHSLFHPCPKSMLPDRKHYYADDYDVERMLAEISIMNNVLFGIDGKDARTYSVPCSQMLVGGIDYTERLRRSGLVKFVRTGGDQYNSVIVDFKALDPFQVPSWGPVDGPDGPVLIAYVRRVEAAHGLGVLQFHGTGGDYLAVSAEAHRQLVHYLRQHSDFGEVMDYVMAHRR